MQNCFVFVVACDESSCVWLQADLTFVFLFSLLFFCARFINARRRIVQPMIDQSNRAGKKKINPADIQYSTASIPFLPRNLDTLSKSFAGMHIMPGAQIFLEGRLISTPPKIAFYSLLFLSLPSSPFAFSQWDVFSSGAGRLLIDSNWRFPSLSGERGILALSLWIANWTQEECQRC